ncbi:hypothetical protein PMAYCL1PPCAC_08340, partial [Pristionchus mayeri]
MSMQSIGSAEYWSVHPGRLTHENPINNDRPTGINYPLSLSSLFASADEELRVTDEFCKACRNLRERRPDTSSSSLDQLQLDRNTGNRTDRKQHDKNEIEVNANMFRMSPFSTSSIFSSADEESRATNAFCQTFHRLSIKANGQSTFKIDIPTNHSDNSSIPWIESLPWPALNRLFHFLRSDEECTDLNNLSKVSTRFYNEVHQFMEINRPGFKEVKFNYYNGNILDMEIRFHHSNLAFYDLSNIDWGRVKRTGSNSNPILHVRLTGNKDLVIEQRMAKLLSSSIAHLCIDGLGKRSSTPEPTLCTKLLGSSTICSLDFSDLILDDIAA